MSPPTAPAARVLADRGFDSIWVRTRCVEQLTCRCGRPETRFVGVIGIEARLMTEMQPERTAGDRVLLECRAEARCRKNPIRSAAENMAAAHRLSISSSRAGHRIRTKKPETTWELRRRRRIMQMNTARNKGSAIGQPLKSTPSRILLTQTSHPNLSTISRNSRAAIGVACSHGDRA